MLRLTDQGRKIAEAAKAAGVPLYATARYAEFLKGLSPTVIAPEFTTAPGLDVLENRGPYGDPHAPIVPVTVTVGNNTFHEGFYFNRTPEDVLQTLKGRFTDTLPITIQDRHTGEVYGKYTPPAVPVPVWLNGFPALGVNIVSTDTEEQRHDKMARVYSTYPFDRYQFGNEAPYFLFPDEKHRVWVRRPGASFSLSHTVKNPTLDLPSILAEGEWEWAYQDRDPVWTRITVKKTESHRTLYAGEWLSVVRFDAPITASAEERYLLADAALRKAGHRPVIYIDGSEYR